MGKVIAAAGVLGALVALVAKQAPELRRYMKIRSM
jgi:uncharacterized protein DUF6893